MPLLLLMQAIMPPMKAQRHRNQLHCLCAFLTKICVEIFALSTDKNAVFHPTSQQTTRTSHCHKLNLFPSCSASQAREVQIFVESGLQDRSRQKFGFSSARSTGNDWPNDCNDFGRRGA
jgi:hypothetical protein